MSDIAPTTAAPASETPTAPAAASPAPVDGPPATLADAKASARKHLERLAPTSDRTAEPTPGAAPPSPWEKAGLTPAQVWEANVELAGKLGEHRSKYERFDSFNSLHPDDAEFMLNVVDAMSRGDRARIAEFAPALREFLDEYADDEFDPFDRSQFEQHVQNAFERVQSQHAAREREWQTRLADANQQIEAHIGELAKTHGLSNQDLEDVVRRAHSVPSDVHPFERLTRAAKEVAATRKPRPPTQGIAPRTLTDARKSARERLARLLPGGA